MSQSLTQENLKNLLLAELQVIGEYGNSSELDDDIILLALNESSSSQSPAFLCLVKTGEGFYQITKFRRADGGVGGYWCNDDADDYELRDAILAFYQEARDFDYRVPRR